MGIGVGAGAPGMQAAAPGAGGFKTIKRLGLTVIPKQEYVDFVNKFYPNNKITLEQAYQEGFQIYLVPNFEDTKKAEAYLKKIAPDILTKELDSWQVAPEQRPPLNIDTFAKFFEYDVSVGIFDTVNKP